MLLSGIKVTLVPFLCDDSCISGSSTKTPLSKMAVFALPSLKACTLKLSESALTALVPTPFNPTDFLKTLESYLAPVFILETTSTQWSFHSPSQTHRQSCLKLLSIKCTLHHRQNFRPPISQYTFPDEGGYAPSSQGI
jgi:hypothetical protein